MSGFGVNNFNLSEFYTKIAKERKGRRAGGRTSLYRPHILFQRVYFVVFASGVGLAIFVLKGFVV